MQRKRLIFNISAGSTKTCQSICLDAGEVIIDKAAQAVPDLLKKGVGTEAVQLEDSSTESTKTLLGVAEEHRTAISECHGGRSLLQASSAPVLLVVHFQQSEGRPPTSDQGMLVPSELQGASPSGEHRRPGWRVLMNLLACNRSLHLLAERLLAFDLAYLLDSVKAIDCCYPCTRLQIT